MHQEARSEHSRVQILDAALKLFAHRGYNATSVQDIAEAAGVSKGNVYHHFGDKESIFRQLLESYFQAMEDPDVPFVHALANGTFPENLEVLGFAVRDSIRAYREYVALIYVDVIEFDGSHIRRFYAETARRLDAFLREHGIDEQLRGKLQDGISPTSAVLLAMRIFFNYFSVEIVFGVKEHFGKQTDEIVTEIARILRHGMLRGGTAPKRVKSTLR